MAAGPSNPTVIKLVCGDEALEICFDAEGGLEALVEEAALKFELHADSFSIFDDFGKVEDSLALQRAVDMASKHPSGMPCVLEVREAPQWKKIREMEAKLNLLVARCPVVDSALEGIEERSVKRFEKLASALQGVEERAELRSEMSTAWLQHGVEELASKVNKSIAPLLQCVALQEMELKAKLESLEASSEEMNSKVNSAIAPMLQNMALHQLDMKCKLDCLGGERLADGLQELSELHSYTSKVQDVEKMTMNLQKEMTERSTILQEAYEQLKVEVHEVSKQATARGDAWILSAAEQDLCKSPKSMRHGAGGFGEWNEGFPSDLLSFNYSKKSNTGMTYNSMNAGGAGAVPFARFIVPRQLDRMQGSRSLPHLPPVK